MIRNQRESARLCRTNHDYSSLVDEDFPCLIASRLNRIGQMIHSTGRKSKALSTKPGPAMPSNF